MNTGLYLKWILKRNIFLNNLCIFQWNIDKVNYCLMNIKNRNLHLKSLTFTTEFNSSKNFDEEILI
jgi:hypothetical protein